jgi:hypothetical protein
MDRTISVNKLAKLPLFSVHHASNALWKAILYETRIAYQFRKQIARGTERHRAYRPEAAKVVKSPGQVVGDPFPTAHLGAPSGVHNDAL